MEFNSFAQTLIICIAVSMLLFWLRSLCDYSVDESIGNNRYRSSPQEFTFSFTQWTALCLWIYNILSWNWHLQTSIVVGVEGGQMKTGNMNWLNLRVSVENGRTETTMYLVVLLGSIGPVGVLWSRMVTEYSMCVVCMCVIIYQPGIREGNGVQRQSSLANRNLGE